MSELADAARQARSALLAGDRDRFGRCVDQTFDLRRALMPLDRRCVAMIEAARSCGASANYTGSGGAIVAVCDRGGQRELLAHRLRSAGAEVVAADLAG
jgi:glucuronokinase